MRLTFLVLFLALVSAAESGTLYFDASSGEVIMPMPYTDMLSSASTRISSAAWSGDIPDNSRWNGSTLVPIGAVRLKARTIEQIRRDVWHLQAMRSQAVTNATTAELNSIDRDIEFRQRAITSIIAH